MFWRSYCLGGHRNTIFALSSGHGKCGVAVIRTSGPASGEALLCLTGQRELPQPRCVTLSKIADPTSGEPLDRGLVLWFPGPRSFTGEDCSEFHVHGGPAVIAGVLQALGHLPGLRLAEAGEFTKRAFQNGKVDLTEAEGIGDLVHAETEAQRRQALRQMAGDLGQLYNGWSQNLLRALAHVEAYIDFSEDDNVEEGTLSQVDVAVKLLQDEVAAHLQDSRRGERLRSGIQMVLAGPTNAGKSSLLNMICQRPAAIVSPIAGTTRDVVEATLNIGGYPVVLSDTAGLRESIDSIEQEGMRRTQQRLDQADLVVVVIDSAELSGELSSGDKGNGDALQCCLKNLIPVTADNNPSSLSRPQHRPCILALNKVDLLEPAARESLLVACRDAELPQACLLSCRTEEGLESFLSVIKENLEKMCGDPLVGAPSLTQTRHRLHLVGCLEALAQYRHYREQDLVLAAEGLRTAQRNLGKITGKVGAEDILDVIFRDFCIGK
ncbi:tRNA modification GTPase GTPBP3, mitochondrial isoform X2 [Rhinatrema bivittatum]|nr:tRNA modification GTPase GTPBP3, mitochondrial isoform X2 [Rhinatrema bivittatum]XP_029469651.1 tRNA modification GTPase GTPBP3, mitochondrial isoform X2 [Rhinatrema bivittatum]